ncbi:MAG: hypothetical protein CMJ06_04530 [Pelagibacterales bacterium]|nr:hypothetical protein [Pelagibacterales bacterium]OUU61976.1 MAG: hypothetical protein CBC22_05980 [Alphaproteobacteria bacterium TMED62]
MNNREYLIHILLKLKRTGIKDEKILKVVEKIPPHYYLNIFYDNSVIYKVDINEVVEIVKLLELSLHLNFKLENVLLLGFKNGWLLVLLTNFCKRIYGICDNISHKEKLELFFFNNNYSNIYLSNGKNITAWNKVAPFDLILCLNINSFSIIDIINLLSKSGIAIIPRFSKFNSIEIISINKNNFVFKQNCDFNLLKKSNLI